MEFAVVLGNLFHPQNPQQAQYSTPQNQLKGLQTAGGNKLVLNDTPGAQTILLSSLPMPTAPYTYDLHIWNSAYNEMMDAAGSLDFYRTSYEDEIPRKKLEAQLSSLDTWAAYTHANQLLYQVYVRLAQTGQPYANLILNDGNVIVSFLDEYHREYLIYTFGGKHEPGRLFLKSLHYFEYPDAQWATPAESSADTRYQWDLRGKLTVTREYSKEDGHRYQSQTTATKFVDVAPNWEPAPALGEYAGVLTLKRWGEHGSIKPLPDPEWFV